MLVILCIATQPSARGDGIEPDSDYTYPDLRASADPDLQRAFETILKNQGLWPQVQAKTLSFALVDISNLHTPRLAAVNADHMMYAASLPKIAILLGAFVEAERGDLRLDADLREQMVKMIRHSSNASATNVLARVGRQDLIEILTSDNLRLYDPAFNGGLWVGKDYARNNAFRRDPLHNLSHGATVYQVARFFYLLETGRLVDDEHYSEMREMLSKPGIEHKFVAGLKSRPGVELFRKSGTWRTYHADAALVEYQNHRYVIAGLAQNADGGKWLTRLAAPMHDLVVTGSANKVLAQR